MKEEKLLLTSVCCSSFDLGIHSDAVKAGGNLNNRSVADKERGAQCPGIRLIKESITMAAAVRGKNCPAVPCSRLRGIGKEPTESYGDLRRVSGNGTRLSHFVEDFPWRVFGPEMLEVFVSGLLHPLGAFGPSFDASRLVAARAFDHAALRDSLPHDCRLALAQDGTLAEADKPLPADL